MHSEVIETTRGEPIIQFFVFADKKVGRLNELIRLLLSHDVHIIAMSTQDATDSTLIRIVVDHPQLARDLLLENNHPFTENHLVAVEIDSVSEIKRVTAALLQAEINIHYVYSFISRPDGKSALAIRLEDNELAEEVLKAKELKVLSQGDISR